MLKRVSIQNFKSLKDVTLDLRKVNLLIGSNNSGKTNFLKALEFLGSLKNEINIFNDVDLYKRNTSDELKVLMVFDSIFYSEIRGHKNSISVFTKKQNFFDKERTILFAYSDSIDRYVEPNESEKIFEQTTEYTMVAMMVRSLLKRIVLYKPDPNQFIKPQSFSADAIELKGDCSNLIQFLFYLSTNNRRVYQNIENDLARCIGDIVSISTPPVKVGSESKLGLKFFGRKDEDFWAEDVSEGVLYFLALVTIVNQPNPPKLLLLEEPEKGIHPRRIREVMDFVFRLAEEKDVQIILTTHNEHVLDEFATRPEAVFVFDKDEEGATYVKNLQHDIIEPTNERNRELGLDPVDLISNLSENWLYGLLGGVPAIP